MRVLLIAYDYPPTQSPRALRWRYLTRELALLGHEVHVLTPDLGAQDLELPRSPGRIVVHHTFAGPFGWLVGAANRRRSKHPAGGPGSPAEATRLNWRGRLVGRCKQLAGRVLFPDVRAEWTPWARGALRRLLAELEPDVVVTSHEPASTLPLGMYAQRRGFAWVADLGDPVCAAYTPARWRRRAMALEACVATQADRVLVTNEATSLLLMQRHGHDPQRYAVLPNGYDDRRVRGSQPADGVPGFDEERLELVYAGRLYGYRDPSRLLQAVAVSAGVRLTMVVPDPPEGDAGAAIMAAAGDRLRALGPLPHAQVQALLERADVLVNFGDHGQPVRIAAKVYEYLGISRPILHVHSGDGDAAAGLLRSLRRGWLCGDDTDELAALLEELRKRKQEGRLDAGLDLDPVEDFAHSSLGVQLAAHLGEAAQGRAPDTPHRAAGGPRSNRNHHQAVGGAGEVGPSPPQMEPGEGLELHEHSPEHRERELADRYAQVMQLKAEAKERESQINILNQRLEWMDAQIRELHASTSWRITAPLRALATAVRNLKVALRNGGGRKPVPQHAGPMAQATVLDGEDTFVLYRIIGNDLPPRHKRGQGLENLRFILEHEPVLARCEKRFVLNRIRDPDQEQEIIGLLDRHGFGYIRIPFEPEAYLRTGFDTDILPEPGFLAGERIESLDPAERDRLIFAIYRHKNNYAMNNNGARNAALRDGRSRAKWILPWDGNCFLTRDAWESIRSEVGAAPGNRYFIVPMARMLDNEPLVRGGPIPKAAEEPQIIFRADAGDEFNPAFCYGRRPKVELLWRLGVKGPWDKYDDDPWDQARRPLSPEAGLVGRAGWVARLFSGMGTLEASSDHSTLHRGVARSGAIMATLQHLDARMAGADPERPVSIRMPVLQQEIQRRDTPPLSHAGDALLQAADEAWSRWQAPAAMESLQPALVDPVTLALAHAFTGEDRYATAGAGIIEYAFVDPDTRIDASAAYGQPQRVHDGGSGAPGVTLAMKELYFLLDAVRMFENAGALGGPVRTGFRAWLQARQDWLLNSPEGLRDRAVDGHVGTWYDLQVAAVAAYLDEHATVYRALIRAQARVGEQFVADGRQPAGLNGTDTAHACCLNFQGWIHLADLAAHWGCDLWRHKPRSGAGLEEGGRWLVSHMGKPWPYEQANGFDVDRFQPIRFAVAGQVGDPPDDSPYVFKRGFSSPAGIRPFWNLGSYGQPMRTTAGTSRRPHER